MPAVASILPETRLFFSLFPHPTPHHEEPPTPKSLQTRREDILSGKAEDPLLRDHDPLAPYPHPRHSRPASPPLTVPAFGPLSDAAGGDAMSPGLLMLAEATLGSADVPIGPEGGEGGGEREREGRRRGVRTRRESWEPGRRSSLGLPSPAGTSAPSGELGDLVAAAGGDLGDLVAAADHVGKAPGGGKERVFGSAVTAAMAAAAAAGVKPKRRRIPKGLRGAAAASAMGLPIVSPRKEMREQEERRMAEEERKRKR